VLRKRFESMKASDPQERFIWGHTALTGHSEDSPRRQMWDKVYEGDIALIDIISTERLKEPIQ
jgi:hypothetical protein